MERPHRVASDALFRMLDDTGRRSLTGTTIVARVAALRSVGVPIEELASMFWLKVVANDESRLINQQIFYEVLCAAADQSLQWSPDDAPAPKLGSFLPPPKTEEFLLAKLVSTEDNNSHHPTPDWLKPKSNSAVVEVITAPFAASAPFEEDLEAAERPSMGNRWPSTRRPSTSAAEILSQSRRALSRSSSLNHVMVQVQRSLSSQELTPTFLCVICYENVDVAEKFTLGACENSSHSSCATCATEYFKGRISEGRLSELLCPIGVAAQGGCSAVHLDGDKTPAAAAAAVELEQLLANDPEALEQFQLLSKKQKDPSLCECPSCKQLCRPDAQSTPVVLCACGATFCAFHAWGHKNESEERGAVSETDICANFERKMLVESRANDTSFGLKHCPCSDCGAVTMKNGGCNHMTCKSCKGHWCWVCGNEIDGNAVGWHYSEDNTQSGCLHFADPSSQDISATMEARRERAQQKKVIGRRVDWTTWPFKLIIVILLFSWFLPCFVTAIPVIILLSPDSPKYQTLMNGVIVMWFVILGIPFLGILCVLTVVWWILCIFLTLPLMGCVAGCTGGQVDAAGRVKTPEEEKAERKAVVSYLMIYSNPFSILSRLV
jgi:hypothetical protein